MLKGILKVIDKEQMDRLHEGILNVLENTGLQIRSNILSPTQEHDAQSAYTQPRASHNLEIDNPPA